jgi:hypothetical protein
MPALTVVDRQAHAGVHGAANNDIIQPQIPFSEGVAFASALVVEDTLWVFGTNDVEMNGGVPRTQVTCPDQMRVALAEHLVTLTRCSLLKFQQPSLPVPLSHAHAHRASERSPYGPEFGLIVPCIQCLLPRTVPVSHREVSSGPCGQSRCSHSGRTTPSLGQHRGRLQLCSTFRRIGLRSTRPQPKVRPPCRAFVSTFAVWLGSMSRYSTLPTRL